MTRWLFSFVLLVGVFASRTAWAHKPSDAYLALDVDGRTIHTRWDIALRDLDYAIGLDADADARITWGEVKERESVISAYALSRLALGSGSEACTVERPKSFATAVHSDGAYVVLEFEGRCPSDVTDLQLDYRLFFDVDPQHRGIVRIDARGTSRTHTMTSAAHDLHFDLSQSGRARQLGAIVKEGIRHIWEGYDHILFLLALLLPSVLKRTPGGWVPVDSFKPAIFDVLRIVTAFTLAHSITLSLAALGIVTLPSRLVESTIAASVVLAAVNNLYPVLRHDRWTAAFLLGLMHGFGFSATLMDMNLPRSNLLVTLFGFNLGVEIGQIAIVALFVPTAFLLRKTVAYRRVMLVAGSVAIAVLASIWLVERAFVVKIF